MSTPTLDQQAAPQPAAHHSAGTRPAGRRRSAGDAPAGFSARLRTATAERHSNAENSDFMTRLMKGELDQTAYRLLLGQYRHLYIALEAVSEHFRNNPEPITAPFLQPGLDRTPAILEDLRVLHDGASLEDAALPATAEYVERILATREAPERFLAHHYLRYLGDLSGGQAVAALMARHYQIPAEALSMYRFPDLPKPKVFKDGYRDLLDAAPLDEAQADALVDEAIAGFDLNAAMFADLDRLVRQQAAA